MLASQFVPNSLDEIDAEIAYHEGCLLTLRSRRNLLVPILNLPSEIISRIIRHTQSEDHSRTTPEPGFSTYSISSKWRDILLVCKQFRAVAVAAPHLWTFIDMDWGHTYRVAVALERAKSVPLALSQINIPYRLSLQRTAMANISRAYAASLRLSQEATLIEHSRNLFHVTAPLLTTLSLTANFEHYDFLVMLDKLSSQLVELSLFQFIVDIAPRFAWPLLNRLQLQSIDIEVETLCTLLFNMPALEHLVVKDLNQLEWGGSSRTLPPFHLPGHPQRRVLRCLQTVSLRLHAETCQQIHVDITGSEEHHSEELDKTNVALFEYVLDEWKLFPKPLPPATFFLTLDLQHNRHAFKLVSGREDSKSTLPISTISMPYVCSSALEYATRGVTFATVYIEGISEQALPALTMLLDIHMANSRNLKLILAQFSNLDGLLSWLRERRSAGCRITTLEFQLSDLIRWGPDMVQEIERIRASGVVDNVISELTRRIIL
jgi:hypothetical protein